MALKATKQTAVPEGTHTGRITAARETTKTFERAKGPEPTIEVVIQPDYVQEGAETLPLNVLFSPVLNGLSALSNFLVRIGKEPAEGKDWSPSSIVGTRVEFETKRQENGFIRVLKDSIRAK